MQHTVNLIGGFNAGIVSAFFHSVTFAVIFFQFEFLGFYDQEYDFELMDAEGERYNLLEGTVYHYWGEQYPRTTYTLLDTFFLDLLTVCKASIIWLTIPLQIIFWLI